MFPYNVLLCKCNRIHFLVFVATSNSGWHSRTCGLVLDKAQATRLDKLSVSIPDNCAADVGENSTKLSTQIVLLVCGTIPMATSS